MVQTGEKGTLTTPCQVFEDIDTWKTQTSGVFFLLSADKHSPWMTLAGAAVD